MDVPGSLARLLETWDSELARDLLYEELHHQETLYPASFAALPWLETIAEEQPAGRLEIVGFLTYLVMLITRNGGDSLDFDKGSLTSADGQIVERLLDHARAQSGHWSALALDLIPGAEPGAVGHLLQGALCLAGSVNLVACEDAVGGYEGWMWCPDCGRQHFSEWNADAVRFVRSVPCDWQTEAELHLETPGGERERMIARNFRELCDGVQPKAAAVLGTFSEWSCCQR